MIKKVTLRGLERGDEPEMVKIHQSSVENFERIEIDENFILRLSNRPDFRFFIAEVNGRIAGFLGVLFYENVGRAEIGPIAVDEKYRNYGIGSGLLNDCWDFLGTIGIRRVTTKVKFGNNEGINFFRKNGFSQEVVLRRYTRDDEDIIQFVRFFR